MGKVIVNWDPRTSLQDFVSAKNEISLIRRVSGKNSSPNMAIWGENLAALAALKSGSGVSGSPISVDVIAIDPPYNVGGEQCYKNVWKGVSEQERDWAKDHGAFLDFMEPRLKVGKSLLKEDGVIFVNICDHEYAYLRVLMDQIFESKNYLGTLIWDKNQGSPSSHMTDVHEYILVYAKDATKAPALQMDKPTAKAMVEFAVKLKDEGVPYTAAQEQFKTWVLNMRTEEKISGGEAAYRLIHPESFRPFRAGPSCAQTVRESRCKKVLLHPITKKKCPVPKNGWKWSEETLMSHYSHSKVIKGDGFVIAGELLFGIDENTVPQRVTYLDNNMLQKLPTVIHNSYGGDKDLPAGITFSTPKPVSLIKTLIRSVQKKDAVVLDYFAGSGTVGQAVKELNEEDDGNRSWILIEEMGSTFHKVLLPRLQATNGLDFAIFELQSATIKDQQIYKKFQQYSLDFLSSYHALTDSVCVSKHGMNIMGYDERASQLIALTLPLGKKHNDHFIEESQILLEQIRKSKCESVVVYTLRADKDVESPWATLRKDFLKGTTCKTIRIVSIPKELIEEWNQVLIGIAA